MSLSVRRVLLASLAVVIATVFAVPASAQTAPGATSPLQPLSLSMGSINFSPDTAIAMLPASDDQAARPQAPPPVQPRSGGFGVGLKGGFIFPKFPSLSGQGLQTRKGWQIGLFLGGNRPGRFGVFTELTIKKRTVTDIASGATKYAFQVPILFRFNIGSPNKNHYTIYPVFGASFDFNLNKFSANVVGNTSNIDVLMSLGLGVEISRAIVEFRWNKGWKNILTHTGNNGSLKGQEYLILLGVRFN